MVAVCSSGGGIGRRNSALDSCRTAGNKDTLEVRPYRGDGSQGVLDVMDIPIRTGVIAANVADDGWNVEAVMECATEEGHGARGGNR